jgi:hypothetical protein
MSGASHSATSSRQPRFDISDEFRAVKITRKAIDLLSPPPSVKYDYVVHLGKRLFVSSNGIHAVKTTYRGFSRSWPPPVRRCRKTSAATHLISPKAVAEK